MPTHPNRPFTEADLEALFESAREQCLPAVWTRAVSASRVQGAVFQESIQKDEVHFRVVQADKAVHPKVTLWVKEGDWFCSCGDRNDPCVHTATAIIALKADRVSQMGATTSGSEGAPESTRPAPAVLLVRYQIVRESDRRLALRREFWRPAHPQSPAQRLDRSLVGYIGGVRSGRISSPPVSAREEDLKMDQLLGPSGDPTAPTAAQWKSLLPLLKDLPPGEIRFEGKEVSIDLELRRDKIIIRDAPGGAGYQLEFSNQQATATQGILDRYSNGVGLSESDGRLTLFPVEEMFLTRDERAWLFGPQGRPSLIPLSETEKLASRILPGLRARFDIDVQTKRLPERVSDAQAIVLMRWVEEKDHSVVMTPLLGYALKEEILARVEPGQGLDLVDPRRIPVRRDEDEHRLTRFLQSEFQLALFQPHRLQGSAALRLRQKLENFVRLSVPGMGPHRFRILEDHASAFRVISPEELKPIVKMDENRGLWIEFAYGNSASSSASSSSGTTAQTSVGSALTGSVSYEQALQAYRNNDPLVRLMSAEGAGGYAKLPFAWIQANFGKIEELIARLKNAGAEKNLARIPRALLPEALELAVELGAKLPSQLDSLAKQFLEHDGIPAAVLPTDIQAELRAYQKVGVDWLRFLGDHGLGACLADDMGLGKTLQALCAIEGRTLVVAPTSVLLAWREQARTFRPGLKLLTYHGPNRKLDTTSDIVLTTYGILRQDAALLTPLEWDTVVLDEAQVIKNPDSKTTQTAWQLRGSRRITLSGTPIENRLDELWSQMRFLNPGLLPQERREFQDAWESPILSGDSARLKVLRRKMRPFLLRRLKKEVAPELPPRTETLLHCELDSEERNLYQALLATARKEVIQSLEAGESTLKALERILRLRQACCHRALLPGENAPSSSKLELLMETLEESMSNGHRTLVFSQWTSLLDQVQARFEREKIPFLRLDGSTRDREGVVRAFQASDGPPVLLISLKAGGTGLTLTAADHVVILDPWWNPATEDQAADRAHRIGQTQPVLIQRMVARDTIEERILELQARKRELAQKVLGPKGAEELDPGAAGELGLTRQDLLGLLN